MKERIKIMSCYKTRDGKVFEDIKMAKRHDVELEFNEWYEDNVILGNYEGSKVDCEDIKTWLTDNRDIIKRFIEATE